MLKILIGPAYGILDRGMPPRVSVMSPNLIAPLLLQVLRRRAHVHRLNVSQGHAVMIRVIYVMAKAVTAIDFDCLYIASIPGRDPIDLQ